MGEKYLPKTCSRNFHDQRLPLATTYGSPNTREHAYFIARVASSLKCNYLWRVFKGYHERKKKLYNYYLKIPIKQSGLLLREANNLDPIKSFGVLK